MKVAHVIGKVTLSQCDPGLAGQRFLLVDPVEAEHFNTACRTSPPLSGGATFVAVDHTGAGTGDVVGIVEGGEATVPFENPAPVDALAIALFDKLHHVPATS